MAYTTLVYYHDLNTRNATKYRLYFIPGDTRDLTADDWTLAQQMPHDFIKSCKITRGFDNDMPVGQELASAMEIEFNFSSSHLNTSMTAMRDYILAQETDPTTGRIAAWLDEDMESATYGDPVTFTVPNRWFIGYSTDNWTSFGILWDGVQELVKKYEFNSDGVFKITVWDMVTTIMRQIPIKQIGWSLHNTYFGTAANLADELCYYICDYTNGYRYHISNSENDWGVNYLKYLQCSFVSDFIAEVEEYANTLLALYRRQTTTPSVPLFYFRNNPLSNWTLYKQNYNGTAYGTEITDKTTINYINSIFIDGSEGVMVGGCCSDTKSEGSWGQELKNLNNLLKGLAENFFYKGYYGYDSGTVNYLIMPIFAHSVWDGTTLTTPIAINSSNIVNDWKVEYGTEWEQSICHIQNGNDEDILELSVKNDKLGIDEGSYEVKNILHNAFCSSRLEKFTQVAKADFLNPLLARLATIATVTQSLFTDYVNIVGDTPGEARIAKIAEYCKVTIDGTEVITSEDYTNASGMYGDLGNIVDTAVKVYSQLTLPRQATTGIPYTVAKAANQVFNTRFQGMIDFSTHINTVGINELGRGLAIDFSDISLCSSKIVSNTTNAIITGLEWDTFTDYIQVKAFIRGD